MITINTSANNISMDGIELATRKENINSNILHSENYFFEFNSKYELITISTRLVQEFSVNGKVVSFDNINDFLLSNNALMDDKFIIVPDFSLSLYIDYDKKIFLEVLIYSSLVKKLFEKSHLKLYKDCMNDKPLVFSDMIFIPFISVGEYNFGESEEVFLSKTKLSFHEERGVNNKKYYDFENSIFRFDQDKLSQIYIYNPDIKIIFNQININTIEGLNSLLNQYSVVKSRSHDILLDLGVAIKSNVKNTKDIELYFFDKDLVKYWQNIHRPITSW